LKESVVSIVKTPRNPKDEEVRSAVRKAIDLLGGIEKFVKPGSKALVKPNMCWPWLELRVTTDARVTAAVAELCFEAGAKEVYVGEGAGVGTDTDKVFDSTGTRQLAEKAGAKVVDFKDNEFVLIENPQGMKMNKFKVAKLVKECDTLINVPMMKIDYPTTFTCALKNWAGILDDDDKLNILHRMGTYWTLSDLLSVVRQDLIVVDGITPPEVPNGIFREMDLILAGNDPVAIDAVASKTMGLEPIEINVTRIAMERGLGNANLDKIKIRGEPVEKVTVKYDKPPLYINDLKKDPRFKDINFIDGLACSGCVQAILFTWNRRMTPEILKHIKDLTILVGPLADVPPRAKNVLVLGKCLKEVKDQGEFVDGCIPYSVDIFRGIKRLYGLTLL